MRSVLVKRLSQILGCQWVEKCVALLILREFKVPMRFTVVYGNMRGHAKCPM